MKNSTETGSWCEHFVRPSAFAVTLGAALSVILVIGCVSRETTFNVAIPDTLKTDIFIRIERDSCIVSPSPYHTGTKGYAVIEAVGTDATILFPEPGLTPNQLIDLKAGERAIVTILPYTTAGKSYRYLVFSHRVRHSGVGKSEPEMIVP